MNLTREPFLGAVFLTDEHGADHFYYNSRHALYRVHYGPDSDELIAMFLSTEDLISYLTDSGYTIS